MTVHKTTLTLTLALAAAAAPAQQNVPEDIFVSRVTGMPIVTESENSNDVEFADLDGDGDRDVLVANSNAQDNSLFWNNGSGQFTKAFVGPFVNDGGTSRDVAVGDVDGDGDLDLFVSNGPTEPNFLYLNRGGIQGGVQGVFERVTTGPIATDNANSRRATFGDIDGDGDLDLFVANSSDDDNFLYVNQGGAQAGTPGAFAKVTTGPVVNDGGVSHEGCFGDIDGDSDLDLFVANHGGVVGGQGAVNFLYVNDGTGDFTRIMSGAVATDVNHSQCAAFGDIDGDGDLDLFVGNNQGQDNTLYENDGKGLFTKVSERAVIGDAGETKAARFVDIDLDGDLDLLVANKIGDANVLYLNDGTGEFARQSFGPLVEDGGDSQGVAVGDLNGDGLPDIMFANLGEPNFLYRYVVQQWSDHGESLAGSSGNPVLKGTGNFLAGSPFTLSIQDAAPGAGTYLVLGLSRVELPFKGGMLVPAPDFLFSTATNGSGAAGFGGVVMPGIPASLDLTFQAWISDGGAVNGFASTNAVSLITP